MNNKPHFPYCLNCGTETKLVMGNPAFTYFICPSCNSHFELNVFTEIMKEIKKGEYDG